MKPIEGWDLINEAGDFKRLPAGIYGVKITKVVDNPKEQYFEVYCDIVKGEYANYFATKVQNGGKDTSKSIRSYKDKALPFFKGFITAIEKTNPGYKWDWDETKLVGKKVMAVFGEEEYLDADGTIKVSTKVVEFRSLEAYEAGKLTVPPLKKLEQQPVEQEPEEEPVPEDDDFPF